MRERFYLISVSPAQAYPMLGAQTLPDGLYGSFWSSLLATVLSTFNSFSFMAAQTLGQDLINRIRPMRTELLQTLCLGFTLSLASALVIIIPSADRHVVYF